MGVQKINQDLYIGDTGKQLKDIKTNADNIKTNANDIKTNNDNINTLKNNLNVGYEVITTTPTSMPVKDDTSWKTLFTKKINKGLYLLVGAINTNNWGSGGRDFPLGILLNDVEIYNSNQVLVTGCYTNTRCIAVVINVENDNSTLFMRVRSSNNSPYAVSSSELHLIKLNKI